jgi:hypothetical protein
MVALSFCEQLPPTSNSTPPHHPSPTPIARYARELHPSPLLTEPPPVSPPHLLPIIPAYPEAVPNLTWMPMYCASTI